MDMDMDISPLPHKMPFCTVAVQLQSPTPDLTPTDTFSFDEAAVASQVSNPNLNPRLADEPIDLYSDARDPTRTHRPFLACNSAMFLKEPNTALDLLAARPLAR